VWARQHRTTHAGQILGGRDPCNPCGVHAYGCVADLRRCLPTTSVTGFENVNRGQIGACPNTPPRTNCPFPRGRSGAPSKTRGSLSPRESTHQTASRSVHPFLQDSYACDQQTDRPRYTCNNRPHLMRCTAMRPKKTENTTREENNAQSAVQQP